MSPNLYRHDRTGHRKILDTVHTDVTIFYQSDFLFPDDGFSFHWTKDCVSNPHKHNFYEFALITEGDFTHNINGSLKELPYGALVFILPSDIHALYPNRKCTQMNLAITEEKLRELCNIVSPNLFDQFIKFGGQGDYIILKDFELQWFLDRANQITTLFTVTEKHSYVQLLISEMISSAISITCRNRPTDTYPEWFSDLLTKIQEADWQTFKVNDVYEWSHYSPAIIGKYFKKYKGETIISYIKKTKLKRARNLLLTTDFDILTISTMLGYDSLSHFNRIFKTVTGKTPTVYRKEHQAKKSASSTTEETLLE